MRAALGFCLVLLSGSAVGAAQQPGTIPAESLPTAKIVFEFERPGLSVPRFTMTINEDGTGRYQADEVFPAAPGTPSTDAPATQHIDRPITVSAATVTQIFRTSRGLDRFSTTCASSMKNIADTGRKTLRYTGPDGEGTCTYNFSQDKRVGALTDTFLAIALTLDLGRKLEFDHRFDRLGLDATMASLVELIDAGRAAEVGTIASTLKSIVRDSELLERVRSRAARLLKQAGPNA